MKTHAVTMIVALLLPALAGANATGSGSGDDSGTGSDPSQPVVEIHDRLDLSSDLPEAAPRGSTRDVTTRFRNPLLSNYWRVWTAYFDLDSSTGLLDFECLSETYDGHPGDDQAILDFVAQDEGRFVVAAAPGTVIATSDGYFDKQTSATSTPGNEIILRHDDGSESIYGHLRKWSVMVYPGQQVFEGQALGLVASSGQSNGPHLHFGVRQGGVYLEPHAGVCRPGDSLWTAQEPHFDALPATLAYGGISAVSPTAPLYWDRPPNVEHYVQTAGTKTFFWNRMRYLHPGDVSRLVYTAPDASVYRDYTYDHTQLVSFSTLIWQTTLPAVGSTGTWQVDYYLNDVLEKTLTFTYDKIPDQLPVAVGRTIAVPRGVAGEVLEGSDADGGITEFQVVTPPAHGTVTLHGPRQKWFSYTPDSGFAGTDSFTFTVEDALGQTSAEATISLDVSPLVANALWLEGEDGHVAIPDNGSLNLAEGFTLEAWVRRTTGSAGWLVLVDRRNPDNTTGYSLGIQPDSTLRLQVGNGSTATFAYGTTPIPMDRWSHVAGTWDGTTLRLFVDGVEEPGSVPFGGPISYPGTYETWLGRSRTAGNSFRGEIDEMRVWSVARTAAELQSGAGCAFLTGSAPATLRGWWKLNGDETDASLFGNHGSLVAPGFFRGTDGGLLLCAGQDADSDGLEDVPDNCSLAPNAGQSDADSDGLGDVCDLCPGLASPRQFDSDADGVGDACDRCPFVADTEQLDEDSDGTGDLCDLDPQDGSIGVPAEVTGLSLVQDQAAGATTLSWDAAILADSYAVVRSSLEQIQAGFHGVCVSGSDPDLSDTSFVDDDTPAPGELFGYIVAGVGADGVPGIAGWTPGGPLRDLRAVDCSE
jgi:murein DD-endopeptidase MepM/ murein hydrolase activator NlpD